MPFMVLLHEFGHAIIALLFTKGPVHINLGNRNLNKSMTIGRIKIIFRGYTSILDISFGQVFWGEIKGAKKRILVFLGGPLISLVLALITLLIIMNFKFTLIVKIILRSISLYSFNQFLITIIPIEYKFQPYNEMKSDGYRIREILSKYKFNK